MEVIHITQKQREDSLEKWRTEGNRLARCDEQANMRKASDFRLPPPDFVMISMD